MNRENLEKLATYLESGDLKARFDMRRFTGYRTRGWLKTDCGSVGCAIGHGPYAGIPKLKYEHWAGYSWRIFGLSSIEWNFLFSLYWADIDNTPQGAAKRIRWLLEGRSIENYGEPIPKELQS